MSLVEAGRRDLARPGPHSEAKEGGRVGLAQGAGPVSDWRLQSRCREVGDPEWWSSRTGRDQRAAAEVCAECPVRTECLAYAIGWHSRAAGAPERPRGVWGGWLFPHDEHREPGQVSCQGRAVYGRRVPKERPTVQVRGSCTAGHITDTRSEPGRVTWEGPCGNSTCSRQVQARRVPRARVVAGALSPGSDSEPKSAPFRFL